MAGEYTSSTDTRRGFFVYLSEATGNLKERQLEYAIVDGRAVFEGDIILGTAETIAAAEEEGSRRMGTRAVTDEMPTVPEPGMVVRGVVIVGAQYRWPEGVIPYRVDPGLPNQQRITDAIAHWEEHTPIRFAVRSTETNYVRFVPSTGCWSYVGRQGGRQDIGLAGGCTTGNTIHEIGHAVGLWHEQSREDRDDHVTVHWENIAAGYEHNFNQHIADGDDVGPYDYGSLMHYGRTAFSTTGADTITPPPGVMIGQRNGLSVGDIAAVVYMYGEQVLYVGNKNSRELHMPDCQWVDRMLARNKKYFTTQEEALTSGYNGCWFCMRHHDTG